MTRSNRTLRHGQIERCPCRERAITVHKCSTAELHAPQVRVRGRSRTCDLSRSKRSNCDLHHCQTGAPRSARTFVSSSSGKRLSCLSYRGKFQKQMWRPELDSNQRCRLRRPSTGSIGRGELERANGVEPSRASLATMLRTMRARVVVAAAGFAPATSDLSGRCSSA